MAYDYDSLYRTTPDALGQANAKISNFLDGLTGPLRVLDVGCGQGRDALPAARRGHSVLGIDLSPSGVAAMVETGKSEGLNLRGEVADITTFQSSETFDVLLIDRTLHMLDETPRHLCLQNLLHRLDAGGWLLLVDEPSNMAGLRAVCAAHGAWEVAREDKGLLFQRLSA